VLVVHSPFVPLDEHYRDSTFLRGSDGWKCWLLVRDLIRPSAAVSLLARGDHLHAPHPGTAALRSGRDSHAAPRLRAAARVDTHISAAYFRCINYSLAPYARSVLTLITMRSIGFSSLVPGCLPARPRARLDGAQRGTSPPTPLDRETTACAWVAAAHRYGSSWRAFLAKINGTIMFTERARIPTKMPRLRRLEKPAELKRR